MHRGHKQSLWAQQPCFLQQRDLQVGEPAAFAERFRAWTLRELVALVADQPPLFPPGTAWSYCNTHYALAGLIVETATGRKLGKELTQRIERSLGPGS